ncbi:cysteine--tRNA ligase [Gammaproteobacteria bacterium 45_16_T64]|nr:cysteine--tRNA ligase [Gammaproteobacteria bacterium 45_16_T64]
MTIKLHNTLTQQKDVFVPINPDHITMYVCGPTVYNFVHIGNARPVVIFDVLYRLLSRHFPKVTYARNITDVDDKINKAAAENNESIKQLSSRFADAFHEDMAQLHTLTPDLEPRATDNIDAMIETIQALIEKGHAYEAEEHVLFQVSTDPNYGQLSNRNLDDMIAGKRVEVEPYKRAPGDFVLWKPSTDDLPGWDSPWGRGRPGWHIECSAMINKHLGKTIDIHCGGQDLIFPHHENEIAQGTCCHDQGSEKFVNYWMHNGYITMDGEKMAKSVGNFFTVRELLEKFPGEVLRFALLTAHYRSPLDWSEDTLIQAKASLDRLYGALRNAPPSTTDISHPKIDQVEVHLKDDLATPQALSVLHALAGDINKSDGEEKAQLQLALRQAGDHLGLLSSNSDDWFKWQADSSNNEGLSDGDIDALIEERLQARTDKNFARSDEIRDELKEQGIILEDSKDGTRWTRG